MSYKNWAARMPPSSASKPRAKACTSATATRVTLFNRSFKTPPCCRAATEPPARATRPSWPAPSKRTGAKHQTDAKDDAPKRNRRRAGGAKRERRERGGRKQQPCGNRSRPSCSESFLRHARTISETAAQKLRILKPAGGERPLWPRLTSQR
jgi:hypothetical protein